MKAMAGITLIAAATNCSRDGATAIITLKSGVQFEGALEKPNGPTDPDFTAHMKLLDGGWATIEIGEIAAISTRPHQRYP